MRHVAVFIFVAAQVTVASAPTPWEPVPDGWTYVELTDMPDSWDGVFHDKRTGACILFGVTFPFVVAPVRETTAPVPPGYSGFPVRYVDEPNELCSQGRTVRASFFPQGDSSESLVWGAYSETCGTAQHERVQEFLFLGGGQPRNQSKDADRGRLHSRSELESISAGRSFTDIRKQLGATLWAECHRDGSFTATWTEEPRPKYPQYRNWTFKFNQDQKLISRTQTQR